MFATRLQRFVYHHLAKPLFFRHDPESVHDAMCSFGRKFGRYAVSRRLLRALFAYEHPSLRSTVCGISFRNPVGLSAGFDKNAELTDIIPSVGFGFEEVGSITGEPCQGNPKPRLWRLPKTKGLVVYYGLKNDGSQAIVARLRQKTFTIPIGTSIAKTNNATIISLEAAVADYMKAFQAFTAIGDYFTINISCPNAYGGEPFADPKRLEDLLSALDPIPTKKPIFLKIAADISFDELDALVAVADRHRIHGFILTNLTKDRTSSLIDKHELETVGKGGISGRPTGDLSNALISHLYKRAGNRYAIIGVGGIFTAQDAYEKIKRGASLVQLITGMIYEGPQLIGEINRDLVELLKKDGFQHIHEAVGTYS
ncbi:MAG: quinone-dependent dihydroorotate dehydrogenase [Patescibacteria group bacterium]